MSSYSKSSLKRLPTCLEVNKLLQPANPALKDLDIGNAIEELPVVLVGRALGEANSRGNLPQFAAAFGAGPHAKRVKWPNG
jgi:hypothetical protein